MGRKTGGRDFQKGCAPGPGRPKMPEDEKLAWKEIKQSRQRGRYEIARLFAKFQDYEYAELLKFVKRTDVPVLELLVARGMTRVLTAGKTHDLETLIEMMCGPEPKQVELSGPDGEPLSQLGSLSTEQLVAVHAEVNKIIQKAEEKNKCSSNSQSVSSGSARRSSRRPSGTE